MLPLVSSTVYTLKLFKIPARQRTLYLTDELRFFISVGGILNFAPINTWILKYVVSGACGGGDVCQLDCGHSSCMRNSLIDLV